MVMVPARLKCGCNGHEDVNKASLKIRFLTATPCPAHVARRWQYVDLPHTDLAWRDEAAALTQIHDNGIFTEFLKTRTDADPTTTESYLAFLEENYPEDHKKALKELEDMANEGD